MKCKMATLLTGLFAFSSMSAAVNVDTVESDGKKITIRCSGQSCTKKDTYYVNFPDTVVSPPNNDAYTHAAINVDNNYIYLSGVTGQDLNGDPVPPVGTDYQAQITQAYQNLVNELNYLQIPLSDVVKLDVLIEGGHGDFETRRFNANVAENLFWGPNSPKPPRTITGVSALNLGVLEVSAIVANPYKVEVKKK